MPTSTKLRLRSPFLVALLALFAASDLTAGVVLTIDNADVLGAPLGQATLTGTLSAIGVTAVLLPSSPAWNLSSSVLTVIALTPSGLMLPDGGSYNGPIALVEIGGGAADGNYSSNAFSISFDDDNGRTLFTNSVNLTVEVQTPAAASAPEPAALFLVPAGLIGVGIRKRYELRRQRGAIAQNY
jgi:hypothetical protein